MDRDNEKVIILLAHPNINESNANKELIEAVKDLDNVFIYNLYEAREDLLDVEEWSKMLSECCGLIFQFPLYWAQAPYMLKRWLDEVFTHISKTPVIAGKPLMVVTTTDSDCSAYRSGGRNRFTMDEILRPYQLCAIHSGMRWASPIVVYGVGLEDPARSIAEGAIEYKQRVEALIEFTTMTNQFER